MKFPIIYMDYPRDFRCWSKKGRGRTASSHYDVMSWDSLKAMPIGEIAADDCVLFSWACASTLPEDIEVVKALGFTFKTIAFTWIKLNKDGNIFKSLGYYTRCLGGQEKVFILHNSEVKYIELKELFKFWDDGVKIHTPNGWKSIYNMVTSKIKLPVKINCDGRSLTCSNNHKLFHKSISYKKQKRHIIDCNGIDDIKSLWEIYSRDGISLLFPTQSVEPKVPYLEYNGIYLSDDIGWLIGLFVADGDIGGRYKTQVRFSLNSEKDTALVDRICKIIDALDMVQDRFFNTILKASVFTYKNRKMKSVYFNKKIIADLIRKFVSGEYSQTKRLDLQLLFQTPSSFRKAFIEGIMDGDGYYEQGKYRRVTLCNLPLIEDISVLSESVGIPSRIRVHRPAEDYRDGFMRKNYIRYSFTLSFLYRGQTLALPMGGDGKTVPIHSFEETNKPETMYDLTVDGGCFIVNGLLSHNSNSEFVILSTRGKILKRVDKSISSVIITKRGRHSAKPPEARRRIVKLFGDLPRVELFARKPIDDYENQFFDGWTGTGLEWDGKSIEQFAKEQEND